MPLRCSTECISLFTHMLKMHVNTHHYIPSVYRQTKSDRVTENMRICTLNEIPENRAFKRKRGRFLGENKSKRLNFY